MKKSDSAPKRAKTLPVPKDPELKPEKAVEPAKTNPDVDLVLNANQGEKPTTNVPRGDARIINPDEAAYNPLGNRESQVVPPRA